MTNKSCPMIPTFPGLQRLLHRLLELWSLFSVDVDVGVADAQLPRALPQLAGGAAGHGSAGESAAAEGGLGVLGVDGRKNPGKMMETLGTFSGTSGKNHGKNHGTLIGEVKDNSGKMESDSSSLCCFRDGVEGLF